MSIFGSRKKSLKILFVASEAAPFVKVGGLGEVMYSLPQALRELGYDARVMIPRYANIDTDKFHLSSEYLGLNMGNEETDPHGILKCNVLRHDGENGSVTYFLENMEYYEKRANVYGYGDDTIRWVLLSKGVLEFLRHSEWKPDVIVACDWQAGFVPNLLHTEYKNDPMLKKITTVFSIHNLRYQGMFDPRFVSEMDYDSGEKDIPALPDENIMKLSGMRRGIRYADVINTVSPNYAKEILGEDFGETLDGILNERKSRLFGILNGINTDSLNPATDPDLSVNYDINSIENRNQNKSTLQKQFGIAVDENKFIAGYVGRMDDQKGLDILIQMMHQMMQNVDLQLVLVGDGKPEFR
jgi:starch synthase